MQQNRPRKPKPPKTKEQFLAKVYAKFSDKFKIDLTNYSGITGNKIKITCPIHGEFETVPRNLIQPNCKTGCKKCGLASKNKSKTKNVNNFLEKAALKHNHQYEYETQNYKNRKSKVIIICKIHGKFVKSAQKHLAGQGCFQCKINKLIEQNILTGGYSEDLFQHKPELKTKKAYLYYLALNKGKLFKIGITTNLRARIRGVKCKAGKFIKDIDVLWVVSGGLYSCFLTEQFILNQYKPRRVYMRFSTELFDTNVLPEAPTLLGEHD